MNHQYASFHSFVILIRNKLFRFETDYLISENLHIMTEITPTGCCPPFDPTPWNDQIIEWYDKLFIKDKVFCILNMPVNFGKVITRIMSKADKHAVTVPDAMCLSDHTSAWNMDVFVAVDKKIPDAKNVKITGKFYCRVYEGDFRKTGEWIRDFKKNKL